MDKTTTLKDLCSFTGFRALGRLRVHPEHSGALIVTLKRRQKKTICACGKVHRQWYDTRDKIVRDLDAFGTAVYLEFKIRRINCTKCQAVKTETI